jgi:hypothetical protein
MPRLSQNLYPDFRTDGGGTVELYLPLKDSVKKGRCMS